MKQLYLFGRPTWILAHLLDAAIALLTMVILEKEFEINSSWSIYWETPSSNYWYGKFCSLSCSAALVLMSGHIKHTAWLRGSCPGCRGPPWSDNGSWQKYNIWRLNGEYCNTGDGDLCSQSQAGITCTESVHWSIELQTKVHEGSPWLWNLRLKL